MNGHECQYLPEYIRCDHPCTEDAEPCDHCKDYLKALAEEANTYHEEVRQILRAQ